MEWQQLLTTQRTGKAIVDIKHERTEFQRDFDRIIFSTPFRRLQDKTQVFPLPGSTFVHNRLTHSIEVSCVGRSLGNEVAARLVQMGELPAEYLTDLSAIVSAACLAHDLGNPPFGHSGERAISHYFSSADGSALTERMTEAERSDLVNFDGNANSFRLLTHKFAGRRNGGFALTFPTVASIVKYPRPSAGVRKFGYFCQDRDDFRRIMDHLGVRCLDAERCVYSRFPLVYLVEAADDICYQVMDIEDAHKLGIVSYEKTYELFTSFFDPEAESHEFEIMRRAFDEVTDANEQIAYLRARVIGKLVKLCADAFVDNRRAIMDGCFEHGLVDHLPPFEQGALESVSRLAATLIYRHRSVSEIELSGFRIIGTLLHEFIIAAEHPDRYYSQLIRAFVPQQFATPQGASTYDRAMAAVDLVAGMTDVYALDLYKKIKGIGL